MALPTSPPPSAVDQAASAKDEKTEVRGCPLEACSPRTNIRQVDFMLEKIYANMSACHLKQENWKRAIDTAEKVSSVRPEKPDLTIGVIKAIAKNPANSKALFRKGKALGELGYFEKAEVALTEAKKVAPNGVHSFDLMVLVDDSRNDDHRGANGRRRVGASADCGPRETKGP